MNPIAILFDFDGTLFYGTTDINYHSINLALQDMGRPPVDLATANSTVGDKLLDACARILGTQDDTLCNQLLDGILRHAPEAIERYAVIEPDCVHMLEALSKRAPLAICSNAESAYLNQLVDRFDIRKYFTCIWHRNPGYDKKRAIPVIQEKLSARKCVMVGDRLEDVTSGKANGCITVAMQNDYGARDAQGGDFEVCNHKEMEARLLQIIETEGV